MTRHIIFESFSRGEFWKKLLCKLTCHVWEKVCDFEIGRKDNKVYFVCIWKCEHCNILQFWILRDWDIIVDGER